MTPLMNAAASGVGEEHLPVDAAVFHGVLDAECGEALLDAGMALVGGEDAPAGGDERAGSGLKLGYDHRMTPL
jgi:hypothetical protein